MKAVVYSWMVRSSQRHFFVDFFICLNRGKRRKCRGEGRLTRKMPRMPNKRVPQHACFLLLLSRNSPLFFLLLLLLFHLSFFFLLLLFLLYPLRFLLLFWWKSRSLFLSWFSSSVAHEVYWFSIRFVWIFGSSFSPPICASIVGRVSLMVNCPHFSLSSLNHWLNFYIDVNYVYSVPTDVCCFISMILAILCHSSVIHVAWKLAFWIWVELFNVDLERDYAQKNVLVETDRLIDAAKGLMKHF